MKTWIVDYVDKEKSLVKLVDDDSKTVVVPKALFEDEISEGTAVTIGIDKRETDNRLEHVNKLMDELFE